MIGLTTEQVKLCQMVSNSKHGILVNNGVILSFPYFDTIYNNRSSSMCSFYNKQITDITALGNLLKTNLTCENLVLSGNQITDITAIGIALEKNSTVTEINLHSNLITDISALGIALEKN
jgi:hypothetical protein